MGESPVGPTTVHVKAEPRKCGALGKLLDLGSSWRGARSASGGRHRGERVGRGGKVATLPCESAGPVHLVRHRAVSIHDLRWNITIILCVQQIKLSKRGGPPNSGALAMAPFALS